MDRPALGAAALGCDAAAPVWCATFVLTRFELVVRSSVYAAVAVLASLLIAGASPAAASSPGRNGSLLATSSDCDTPTSGGCEGIKYGLLTPFSGRGRLFGGAYFTSIEGADLSPAWSPDGSVLALHVWEPQDQLALLPAASVLSRSASVDPAVRAIPQTRSARDPSFSPDGHSLVFSQQQQLGPRLHVRDLRSGLDRTLAAPGFDPDWGARGLIAYLRETGRERPGIDQTDLFVTGPDGGGNRRLTYRGAGNPEWAPDGRQLVFERGSGLHTLELGHRRSRRLTRKGFAPVWSPDGRWIAFNRTVRTRGCDSEDPTQGVCDFDRVYLIRPNGKDMRTLRRQPRRGQRRGAPLFAGYLEDWRPLRPRH